MGLLVRLCGRVHSLPTDADVASFLLDSFAIHQDQYWTTSSADIITVKLRLLGGKGGFGSQLRAQGNRMSSKKRAGNYEACRDLSGRRIRTVNQAKIINEYLKRKPELEAQKQEAIKEKMEKAIAAPDQKVIFKDLDFLQKSRAVTDEVELAVNEALFGAPEDEYDPDSKEKLPMKPNNDWMAELDNL